MNTGEYIGHAVRYFLKWVLIVALIYAILIISGYARVSTGYYLRDLFSSSRGVLLFVALGVISGVYPAFGFIRRRVAADIAANEPQIINALLTDGYYVKRKEADSIVFRVSAPLRQLFMLFDDKVTVTADGPGNVTIKGNRKAVCNAQFRIEAYIRNSRDDE